ncbi:uncharacterized protein LOC133157341 [Syngnathus typhle]|uniref:uncharacterized protein LOC133157341 n=1 Tax=Syngnathus typhle TaxID=161592 RepID=UPI002A6ABD31|nr:uncharacterized protein LOC133157341 [Syngnathus typhle]
MNLVRIILLLCAHTADLVAPVCNGVKDQVVFCKDGNSLKIDPPPPAPDYKWQYGTPDRALPGELKADPTTNVVTGPLEAKHTGLYLAIKTDDTSQTDKFTVIVDAVECTKETPCQVGTGSSIKLNADIEDAEWKLGNDKLNDPANNEPPKFTDKKKALGLFDVKADQSGTYKATKAGESATFPVTVSAKTPVSGVTVKEGEGCDAKLECQFTGDAKDIKWTKDNEAVTPDGKTLTVKTGDSGKYACKVLGFHGGAPVTSPTFPYAYAVSTVSIQRSGRVLTCVADGAVKTFEWLTFGNVPVTASDGKVGSDPSKFTLDAKAIGQFICKVTACDNKNINSPPFNVSGGKGPTGSPGTDQDNDPKPTAATQGPSCSVALLVISVLIELYVVMMM